MGRILQDGFETEGRNLDAVWHNQVITERLDVAEFNFNSQSSSTGIQYIRGVSEPRGGYGKKSYCLSIKNDISTYYTTFNLKYYLTNHCDDTSELYYRVWINPYITNPTTNVNFTRFSALCITDSEFEKRINESINYEKYLNQTNCVVEIEMNDQNTYLLKCYCKGVLVYTYNYLYFNEWVKIDVRLKVGNPDIDNGTNGIFQLRINDKLITTFNGDTGTTNPKYLYIGKPHNNGTKCFVGVYLDDIAINDTTGNVNNSWCGNGSIIGVVPTANGSKTMFTPGVEGTQNFENVDELSPDGDVTYNSSYALNDVDLYKFTIPEELEIPPTESINAISVTTYAKFVEQPTDIGHIVSDGVTDTLIGQQILSNDYESQSSILQEKSDGTKYKVSDIENLEFGYKTLESTQAQEE